MIHCELPEYLQDQANREAEIHCRTTRHLRLLALIFNFAVWGLVFWGASIALEYFE